MDAVGGPRISNRENVPGEEQKVEHRILWNI